MYELRFEELVVAGQVDPAAFSLRVPAHTHLVGDEFTFNGPSDHGYRVIHYRDSHLMGATLGWDPAFPSWVLPGFRLAVSTYDGGQGLTEPDSPAVSLAYRRGFDAVYVSCEVVEMGSGSYSSGGKTYPGHFDDPFVQVYGPAWRYLESRTRDVRLSSGPFAGETAHIVVDPSVLPHLWVTDGGYTVTVSGYLSPADMVRVAESLRRGERLAVPSPSPSP